MFAVSNYLLKKFYHEYRGAVCYAKADPGAPDPSFTTRADWDEIKSTKMDVCARICRYYLYHDDLPDIEFEDGELVLGEVPRDLQLTRNRRILIYAEFPSMTPLLKRVRDAFLSFKEGH